MNLTESLYNRLDKISLHQSDIKTIIQHFEMFFEPSTSYNVPLYSGLIEIELEKETVGRETASIIRYEIKDGRLYAGQFEKDSKEPGGFGTMLTFYMNLQEMAEDNNQIFHDIKSPYVGRVQKNMLQATAKQVSTLIVATLFYMVDAPHTVIAHIESRQAQKKQKKGNSSRSNKKRVTRIKRTLYSFSPLIIEDLEEKRIYDRHTDAWTVRGHWRTYKSGKRVWIKPHVKKAQNDMKENDSGNPGLSKQVTPQGKIYKF